MNTEFSEATSRPWTLNSEKFTEPDVFPACHGLIIRNGETPAGRKSFSKPRTADRLASDAASDDFDR